jgi:TatD DNase family protein
MRLLVDVHCHLDHPLLSSRISQVIEKAEKAGVKVALTAGINPETNRKTLEIAKKHNIVRAALGIYPIETLQREIQKENYPLKPNVFDVEEEIEFIRKNKDSIVAIGECGLDYSQHEDKKRQKGLFEKLITLAEKTRKPMIVHSRKAELDCVEILESSKLKSIVMHCFSGRKRLVKRICNNGWFASIPTNIVRSTHFQFLAAEMPITQLFCETDSPYLSPFKEKTNEPSFVAEAYKKLAEIKGMELEEVINNIWMNWQRVFE